MLAAARSCPTVSCAGPPPSASPHASASSSAVIAGRTRASLRKPGVEAACIAGGCVGGGDCCGYCGRLGQGAHRRDEQARPEQCRQLRAHGLRLGACVGRLASASWWGQFRGDCLGLRCE